MNHDFFGWAMLGLLFALLAVMVLDGIKTQRIYKRMANQERAERAQRVLGAQPSEAALHDLSRLSDEMGEEL